MQSRPALYEIETSLYARPIEQLPPGLIDSITDCYRRTPRNYRRSFLMLALAGLITGGWGRGNAEFWKMRLGAEDSWVVDEDSCGAMGVVL